MAENAKIMLVQAQATLLSAGREKLKIPVADLIFYDDVDTKPPPSDEVFGGDSCIVRKLNIVSIKIFMS